MAGGGALSSFWTLRFVRLLSAPDPGNETDALYRLVPPLVSAHATNQPVVLGWINGLPGVAERDDGFVLLAGAPDGPRTFPFLSSGGSGPQGCLFPAGGRAVPLGDGTTLAGSLTDLSHWMLLGAEPARPDRQQQPPVRGPEGSDELADNPRRMSQGRYEDVALHLADVTFAWLIVAEPVTPGDVRDEFRATQSAARALTNAAQLPGEQALDLALATAQLDHLHRGRSVGLWRVRWMVGATGPDRVREVAELVSATSVLGDHPLRLTPIAGTGSFGDTLSASGPAAEWNEPRAPFVTTSEHLAAVGGIPVREIPGFRLTLPNRFDTNIEKLPTADESTLGPALTLGALLDEWGRPSGDFDITCGALNRHMFVCGATGSGKSQTVRQLLEELAREQIPWLVIEPVKAEYRRMADRLAEAGVAVHVIRLGDAEQPPCMLNPLEPEAGFNLQTHIDMVTALFLASFEAEEPFPQVLTESLRRCYESLGWDLSTGRTTAANDPPYPTLTELQAVADEVVKGVGYGPEVQANVRGFMKVRLGSLRLGTPGRFFESGHPLSVSQLLGRNVVVELEDVGNDQDKAFVIGAILLRIVEHLRVNRPQSDVLRHVTVIEEAHRLLRRPDRAGPAGHAIETFAGLLAEVRAYGEGLVVAEQIPSKIVPDVVKNTAVQVMHRLPARDDRELVGGAMNMTPEQMGYVVGVGRGHAAVFSEGMDRPVLVAMRLGKDREADGAGARDPTDLLLGRRNPSCPPACWEAPCSVTQMQAGAACVAALPGLDLYVELAALNLLRAGGHPLAPAAAFADALRSAPGRARDCGVGQLVQSAVLRRRAAIAGHVDPAVLQDNLVAVVNAAASLDQSAWPELAAPFRLPETLPERRRIEAYLGAAAEDIAPLQALAQDCGAGNTAELESRIRGIVEGDAAVASIVSLLSWAYDWGP